MTQRARQAHLVGSVGLSDTETVFRTVNDILGGCCPRIPDGETGARGYWIRWQEKTFANSPGLKKIEQEMKLPGFKDSVKRYFFDLAGAADDVDIAVLGYADEALQSWSAFAKLQSDGLISPDTRFQVSLPTPTALLSGFVLMDSRADIETKVETRMLEDLAAIQNAIPHDQLAIQWDVCYEVVDAEDAGGPKLHYAPAIEGSIERIGRLCGQVDGDVELGIHLCYGDPGHQHIVQPRDLSVCVAFSNGIVSASPRTVDYIHMPVPRDRADEAFFAPLTDLATPSDTRIIIGLVHHTDGVDGSRARMNVADKYIADYDVATECGFGRRDPETVPELLRIHKELCG
jgi:hypothetical protein